MVSHISYIAFVSHVLVDLTQHTNQRRQQDTLGGNATLKKGFLNVSIAMCHRGRLGLHHGQLERCFVLNEMCVCTPCLFMYTRLNG